MFERFTERTRRVILLAQEEARQLGHHYIGTEHLLLGLLDEGDGAGANVLQRLGLSLDLVRTRVEAHTSRGERPSEGHLPFTPRAKTAVEHSLREAMGLGHKYIGTEHLLLGLVREEEGVAARVLVELGADLERVRGEVIRRFSGESGRRATTEVPSGTGEGTSDDPRGLLLRDLGALLDRNDELEDEVGRLRALLRHHGIDPHTDPGRRAEA